MGITKPEVRLIPEKTNPKFFAEHLAPYVFLTPRLEGKRILEVGCGDGYGAAYVAGFAAGVIAIDYEEATVQEAQQKYSAPNLQFICMDATDLQFENAAFDLVCSFQVIEHIPENKLLVYLSGIKRVLKKNGQFVLSTLNLDHVMKSPLTYEKQPAHCREFRLEELRSLLSKVFPHVEVYGLHLSRKHRFFQRLKKIGVFNFLPPSLDPVKRFYQKVSTDDFRITSKNLQKAIDFICVCRQA